MSQAYDLYKEDASGNPIFVETVIGLAQAKKLLAMLTASEPARYLIYDPTKAQIVEPFRRVALASANGNSHMAD
jgi:hypothetical protein